jgi:aspartate kinase
MSYNDVFQLADMGAKVVHPRAVLYALEGNIPLIIKNTMSDAPGTVIRNSRTHKDSSVTGITSMANKTQVIVNYSDSGSSVGNDIFTLLSGKSINVELINVLPGQEVFTVDSAQKAEVEALLKQLDTEYKIVNNCSKVSLVINAKRSMPEVMSKLMKTLACSNVNILQTSNSSTAVWCLIKEADNRKALNELHEAFFSAS